MQMPVRSVGGYKSSRVFLSPLQTQSSTTWWAQRTPLLNQEPLGFSV